jgi:hypothetical protein
VTNIFTEMPLSGSSLSYQKSRQNFEVR